MTSDDADPVGPGPDDVPPAPEEEPVRRRRPRSGGGAAAAAAAMDELDADDADVPLGRPDTEELFARYRALQPVTAAELTEHVRGDVRLDDGRRQQMWDWTNRDVCRCMRSILNARFPTLPDGRELTRNEGFDAQGNRIRFDPAGGRDEVVAGADVRFNDIVRTLDGVKVFGTGRGLEAPESQGLRTRYQRLVAEEAEGDQQSELNRRWRAQWLLYLLLVLAFAGLLAFVLSL